MAIDLNTFNRQYDSWSQDLGAPEQQFLQQYRQSNPVFTQNQMESFSNFPGGFLQSLGYGAPAKKPLLPNPDNNYGIGENISIIPPIPGSGNTNLGPPTTVIPNTPPSGGQTQNTPGIMQYNGKYFNQSGQIVNPDGSLIQPATGTQPQLPGQTVRNNPGASGSWKIGQNGQPYMLMPDGSMYDMMGGRINSPASGIQPELPNGSQIPQNPILGFQGFGQNPTLGFQGFGSNPTLGFSGFGQNPTLGIDPNVLSTLQNPGQIGFSGFGAGPGNVGVSQDLIKAFQGGPGNVGATQGLTDILSGLLGGNANIGASQNLVDAFRNGPGNVGATQSLIDVLSGLNKGGTVGANQGLIDVASALQNIFGPQGTGANIGFNPNQVDALSGLFGPQGTAGSSIGFNQGQVDALSGLFGPGGNASIGFDPSNLTGKTIGLDTSGLPSSINLDTSGLESVVGKLSPSVLQQYTDYTSLINQLGLPEAQRQSISNLMAEKLLGVRINSPLGTNENIPIPPGGGGTVIPGNENQPPTQTGIPRDLNLRLDVPMTPGGAAADAQTALYDMLRNERNEPEKINQIVQSLQGLQSIPQQRMFAENLPATFQSVEDIFNVLAKNMRETEVSKVLEEVNAPTATGASSLSDVNTRLGTLQNSYRMDIENQFQQQQNELESSLAARGIGNSSIADAERRQLQEAKQRALAAADMQFFQLAGNERRADLTTAQGMQSQAFTDALTKALQGENIYSSRTQSAQQPLAMLLSTLSGLNVAPQAISQLQMPQPSGGGFLGALGGILGAGAGSFLGPVGTAAGGALGNKLFS